MFNRTQASSNLKRFFAGVLLLAGIFSNQAHAVLRDGGIDPSNLSRGSWIYLMPTAMAQLGGNVSSVSNLSSLMFYMKNQGLQYVIIKAAQADTVFTVSGATNFTAAIVDAGHAAGLKVFGYIYTTGANVPGEIAMADYIFQQGGDGLIYDAEGEWETVGANAAARSALAVQLCSGVRTNWPTKFVGLSTWPYRAVHANLPYKEFAYYCDVIMPQVYWLELGDTPSAAVTHMNNDWNSWKSGLSGIWTNSIKPFVGTGQGWSGSGTVTAAQIWEFENALRTNSNPVSPGGYKNVDYWRAELHPPSVWAALQTNYLGRPYTNAPTIQYAPTGAVSSTSATISWPTDQISDNVVEYGLTTGYGTSVTNSTLLWYHNATISGLDPNTSYHYRVKSKGTNNLVGVSTDYVITTPGATVADIIIDQDNANNSGGHTATLAGGWIASSGSAYLTTFQYANPNYSLGTPTRTATFTPNIVTAGNYNVYASWASSSAGGNRCTNAPYRINNGSTTTTRVSQEANGNTFILIGSSKNFSTGTSGYVELGNDVTLGVGGDIVVADAVKFVYIPPTPSAPSITTQPASQSVNSGGSATFTVTATGTALVMYQWKFNGAVIGGATLSSYTKSGLQGSDAGSYSVGITNAIGYSNSANAVLTVNSGPPGISAQPQSLIATQGNNATFSVTATGDATLGYQWQFNSTNISSATTTTFTVTNAQATNAGSYSVSITNVAGTTNSANAVLTVKIPAGITAQPQSQLAPAGSNINFSVIAAGETPLGYQWRFNGTNISGANASAYPVSNAQGSNTGNYSVVVTNPINTVTSATAHLTVITMPIRFDSFTMLGGGLFRVLGSGDPGNYQIEFTTNISNWSTAATVLNTSGTFEWTDSGVNLLQRYYRARLIP